MTVVTADRDRPVAWRRPLSQGGILCLRAPCPLRVRPGNARTERSEVGTVSRGVRPRLGRRMPSRRSSPCRVGTRDGCRTPRFCHLRAGPGTVL